MIDGTQSKFETVSKLYEIFSFLNENPILKFNIQIIISN